MVRFFAHWFLVAVALGVASWILAGVEFDSIWAWLVGGLVLGLLNAVVRPVFTLVTLPLTVLTLGLFYLVINGLVFGLAAWIVPGFEVREGELYLRGPLMGGEVELRLRRSA